MIILSIMLVMLLSFVCAVFAHAILDCAILVYNHWPNQSYLQPNWKFSIQHHISPSSGELLN